MRYVKLGPSGTKVSQFALGTWYLPASGKRDEWGVETVDKNAFAWIVKKAFDAGINFIDTANIYHGRMWNADPQHIGNSERLLGEILKGYDRESYVLATKVRGTIATRPNGSGLGRKHIMWQAKESLARLQVAYIDLYQLHWYDREAPKLETLRTMNHLIDQGLVRYIGSSNHNETDLEDFMQLASDHKLEGFVTMQEIYNLIERVAEKDRLSTARKYGFAVMAYSPMAQGVLSDKYLNGVPDGTRAANAPDMLKNYFNPQTMEALKELDALAKGKGISLAQLALAWLLNKQESSGFTIIPLLGVTNPKHFEESLGSLDVKLTPDEMRQAEEIAGKAYVVPYYD